MFTICFFYFRLWKYTFGNTLFNFGCRNHTSQHPHPYHLHIILPAEHSRDYFPPDNSWIKSLISLRKCFQNYNTWSLIYFRLPLYFRQISLLPPRKPGLVFIWAPSNGFLLRVSSVPETCQHLFCVINSIERRKINSSVFSQCRTIEKYSGYCDLIVMGK